MSLSPMHNRELSKAEMVAV